MSSKKLLQKIHNAQHSHCVKIPAPFGKRYLTYADYIASGQSLTFIEEYIRNTILPTYANTHTESSFTGRQTSHFREEARQIIKDACNAKKKDVLIFTGSGSTGAVDLLTRKLFNFYKNEDIKPVVFIGPYEHHSNILPWRESDFDLIEVPLNDNGQIDLDFLEDQLLEYKDDRPLIGSFSAASNVTGIRTDVVKVTNLIKKYGGLSFWDYAGAAPYVEIDMNPKKNEAIDAIFISPHKLIGGPGTPGVLLVKKSILDWGLPVVRGGGTVHFVTKSQQRYFENVEVREEGGTPAIIESIRAGIAFKLKEQVGAQLIEETEKNYVSKAIRKLSKNKNIYILGNLKAERLGFMAFHIRHGNKFLHHNYVVALLNDLFGIQSRGGCSCAGPYGHDLLDLSEEMSQQYMEELALGNVGSKPGWVRLNFNYFIPKDEFEFILDAMLWIADNGWKLLKLYEFDDDTAIWSCTVKKKARLKSLSSFLNDDQKPTQRIKVDLSASRMKYFKVANKLAKEQEDKWSGVKLQSYKFSQVENPLRWYALADDVDSKVLD